MRVPLKGGVSVRTVMEDGEAAGRGAGWICGSHVPTNPQGTVWKCHSRVGWVLGPSSPTSLMRGPSQEWGTGTVGHRSSWG